MARHLIERKTFEVSVWNRSIDKAQPFKNLGAHVATSPEEAIQRSDVVIVMLWDFQSIKETLSPEKAGSLKGKIIIQMATISPDENLELNEWVKKAGGVFVESPVLGTTSVAEAKKLQCMVGTAKDQFDDVEDILLSFGPVVRYIGEVGKASALKLTFNYIVGSTVAAFATSLALVLKQDLPVDIFMEFLRNSAVSCKYHDIKLQPILRRDFADAAFYTTGALKDLRLIVRECKKLGINAGAAEGIEALFAEAAKKYPTCDFTSVYNIINPQ
eukprot:Phypoly_transcript_15269.p1 GENE.Phypoly_transcript_15269~~Phypoly_transcript_15269.p1  ORF type:complete len:304 (+),score=47.43 Phypoly_transcript_15269:99-914(+)